jgi:hypothetical protein
MQHVAVRRKQARFTRLKARYDEQFDAGHLTAAEVVLRQLLAMSPDWAAGWFDLGLIAKLRRDWPACRAANERALALGDDKPGDPAAWNLGVAATALGDWDAAARAWSAYGVEPGPAGEPMGQVPVRLNPSPRRLGQRPVLVDGQEHDAEVVWGDRLSPAHAAVAVVPLPGSGHRYGDVVLHDGEPAGSRQVDGHSVPVFDELERLASGPYPTVTVTVSAPTATDATALLESLAAAALPAEDWTASVRRVCRACDEGSHDHPAETGWQPERSFGIAGDRVQAATVLDGWAGNGIGRSWER